ncbi:MFS transporter [Nocardioides sp.]|uniref:MFS transporter n=1 Tax=Nocardioides sp. TaxID=35761 RepID=UPI002607B161|nr:MFS transporter [Nocardioides sp.]MDI6909680.1 MFS transporter [Nocardioides sp.]
MSTVTRSVTVEAAAIGEVASGWRPSMPPQVRCSLRSPVTVAMLLSATLQVLWWRIVATGGGDLAAQDAWAEFARLYPGSAYNLSWYGGMHPVSYSVISPYLMAAVGVRPTLVVAGTLSAGLLAWILVGRHGRTDARAMLVAGYAALALVGNAISGRVTFALGTLFALAAISLLLGWPSRRSQAAAEELALGPARGAAVALAAGLATAASPVAGLFLGLVAATLWLRRHRPAAYALGVTPVVVVLLSALLFPFSGTQPMPWYSTILPVLIGGAVALTVPERWPTVRLAAAIYAPAVLLVWLVPSPIGTNISRLGLLFGGVVLVSAAAGGGWRSSTIARRHGLRVARGFLILAVLTSSVWQVATAARDVVSASGQTSWGPEVAPILTELQQRHADRGRVEVVPTRSHREAAVFAPHVPLARGWNRQADAERNPIFYRDRPLTADAYRRWLHRWAVQYVVLSAAEPDDAAVAETELITGGLSYLEPVWSDEQWTLYAVRRATPLVDPPARILSFDAAHLTLYTPHAGDVVVRIADSPWLSLVDVDPTPPAAGSSVAQWFAADACLSGLDSVDPAADAHPHRPNWLVLHAPRAGTYRISAPYKLPRGTSCP